MHENKNEQNNDFYFPALVYERNTIKRDGRRSIEFLTRLLIPLTFIR